MSNIKLPVRELKTALMGLGKVISRRASLPVLQHVRAERAADGATTISATDLDAFASYRFTEGSEGKAESILVPFESLHSIAKGCAAEETITIEKSTGDGALIHYPIGGGTVERHVESLPSDEWPPPPKINGERVLLDGALHSALVEALKCVSSDETRYILRGAYVDVSEKQSHYVVGTDGKHLYSSNSFHVPIGTSVIIPDHRFLGWKGFGQDGDWVLRIESDKNGKPAYIELTSFGWTFVSKAIDGNYPNWRQVLPDPSGRKTTIKVSANALAEFADIIGKLPSDAINQAVGLKLDRQGKLVLFSRAGGTNEPTEVAFSAVEVTGKPVTVLLNRNYLAKALRFGLNEIQIQDALSPVRCTDQSGRQLIIMPIRMDGVTPQPAPTQPQPSSPPQKTAQASPTSGNNNMQNENKDGQSAASPRDSNKTAIETAVEQIDAAKSSIGTALTSLSGVVKTLRQAQREQRGTEKEIQSVRSTLETLQKVRI
jgi:DNA polymerase III sliding clamp (beta) subunit (PCNA family)